jgi:hypothetical protein
MIKPFLQAAGLQENQRIEVGVGNQPNNKQQLVIFRNVRKFMQISPRVSWMSWSYIYIYI